MLFLLRQVDPLELLGTALVLPTACAEVLPDSELADIFGIELDLGSPSRSPAGADVRQVRPLRRKPKSLKSDGNPS